MGLAYFVRILPAGEYFGPIPYTLTAHHGREKVEIDYRRQSNGLERYFDVGRDEPVYGRLWQATDIDHLVSYAPAGATTMQISLEPLVDRAISIRGDGLPETSVQPGDPPLVKAVRSDERTLFTLAVAEQSLEPLPYVITVTYE